MAAAPFNAAEWLVDRHVADGSGDRVAFVCPDSTVTYGQLQTETWRAARMLGHLGVGEGDRVLMVVLDEPAFPAVYLGAMRIGAVPIPVSTMLRAEEVAVLAADSGSVAAVVSAPFCGYLTHLASAAPSLRTAVVLDTVPTAEAHRAETPTGLEVRLWSEFRDVSEVATAATTLETMGFWLYTSGTTGRPKGRYTATATSEP